MMKSLQLGKFYPILGGIERVMYDLLTGISERNHSCDMLCASSSFNSEMIKVNEFGKIICTGTILKLFSTMISPKMLIELRRICGEYDIIHIHYPDPMAALALWYSGYRGIVILHWHSDILKQRLMLKIIEPLQIWLINRANVVVGTTPVYIEQSPFLKSVQEKCTYIPIGIDKIVPSQERVSVLLRKYEGKKIIFSLGRLVEYKGFKYLIEAAKFLSDEYVILIGGTGPLKDDLILLIEQLDLQNKVQLLGRISDEELADYYGACDLFCLSSIWKTEAFAIVQIEAMSCGKPIVATNIVGSGVSWVNKHNVSGLNVSPENPKELAEAIDYILSDEKRYNKFSMGAMGRYDELFRKELMVDKCLNLYNCLL